jgi:hypothetical protein
MIQSHNQKQRSTGTIVTCTIAATVWAFLSSDPGSTSWIIAGLIVTYLLFGYFYLMIYLDDVILAALTMAEVEHRPVRQIDNADHRANHTVDHTANQSRRGGSGL